MAAILDGRHPATKELCEAFGLDASITRSISFSLAVDSVAVLTVQRFIENEELMKAAGVFKKFKLVELEDVKRTCINCKWQGEVPSHWTTCPNCGRKL